MHRLKCRYRVCVDMKYVNARRRRGGAAAAAAFALCVLAVLPAVGYPAYVLYRYAMRPALSFAHAAVVLYEPLYEDTMDPDTTGGPAHRPFSPLKDTEPEPD
eukprot:7568845-Pyramimonas_sp.AAC.1